MADVKIEDTPNRAPTLTDLLPFLLTEEHMLVSQLMTLIKADVDLASTIANDHTHGNKAVIDAITDEGSGLVITGAERTDIGNNKTNLSRKDTVQVFASVTGTQVVNGNSGLKATLALTGNVTVDLQNLASGDEGVLDFSNGSALTVTIQLGGSGANVEKIAPGGRVAGSAETLNGLDTIVYYYNGTTLIYNFTTE